MSMSAEQIAEYAEQVEQVIADAQKTRDGLIKVLGLVKDRPEFFRFSLQALNEASKVYDLVAGFKSKE